MLEAVKLLQLIAEPVSVFTTSLFFLQPKALSCSSFQTDWKEIAKKPNSRQSASDEVIGQSDLNSHLSANKSASFSRMIPSRRWIWSSRTTMGLDHLVPSARTDCIPVFNRSIVCDDHRLLHISAFHRRWTHFTDPETTSFRPREKTARPSNWDKSLLPFPLMPPRTLLS